MLALTCLLLSGTIAQPDTKEPVGEKRKYFRDWLAACRGNGYCSGTAYVRPGTDAHGEAYVLRVGRKVGSASAWNISFTAIDHMPKPGTEVTFKVDDESP